MTVGASSFYPTAYPDASYHKNTSLVPNLE